MTSMGFFLYNNENPLVSVPDDAALIGLQGVGR
jgi:hypothetical protein